MKTKILYSPWFWAWFYTWNEDYPEVVKDKFIIWLIEEKWIEKASDEIVEYLDEKYNWYFYTWWIFDLEICELEEWTKFYIKEYDWSESILTDKELNLIA